MKIYKFKLDIMNLSILSSLIFIPIFVILDDIIILKPVHLIYMILWFILHEIIHYIGFLFSKGVSFNDLVIGIKLENGIMYCMCKKEINKKEIMLSLLLPFFVIGLLTGIIGIIADLKFLIFLSLTNIVGAVGDITMAFFLLKMPNDILYFDRDDEGGFYLKSKKDLSIYNNRYIKNDKLEECPINNKKIRISLISYILIAFMILICFI